MSAVQEFIDQVSGRISSLAAAGPGRDLEKNVRALLAAAMQRLDLVSREEFDTQQKLLAKALEQVRQLEERLSALETRKRR